MPHFLSESDARRYYDTRRPRVPRTDPILAWHWLCDEQRLRLPGLGTSYKGDLVWPGTVCETRRRPILCLHGFHASISLIVSCGYAPGLTLCRVACSGSVQLGTDKLVCQRVKPRQLRARLPLASALSAPADIERVPQVADAGACEECHGTGTDPDLDDWTVPTRHSACGRCDGTGRTDGRRGVGEDYDPGDGRVIRVDLDGEYGDWRTTMPDGKQGVHYLSRNYELRDRAAAEHDYPGAPGNHLAALPAGRLVLDARARRIEYAKKWEDDGSGDRWIVNREDAGVSEASAMQTWRVLLDIWSLQSPDLPRAHVSE